MNRVIAYVDGFNLYFGMRSRGWRRYFWLNVKALADDLIGPERRLVATKYFTSRVVSTRADPEKHVRQNTYLEALGTLPDLRLYFGKYQRSPVKCWECGATREEFTEKMTDVNLAVELMADAFQDGMDTALLVTGDGDLIGAIRTVRRLFPEKAVVVAFPPGRFLRELSQVATAWFIIGRRKFAANQFPDAVGKPDGYVVHRPESWR